MKNDGMRVLVVDDELSMREYLQLLLERAGYRVATGKNLSEGLRLLEAHEPDLVITDLKLGHDSGVQVLKAARARPFPPEVLIITAFGTPATAIECIREGAYDYITKPFDNDDIRLLVERALEKRAIRQENQALRKGIADRRLVLGTSKAMEQVWTLVDRVAASPRATVLIQGESGTGKELVARTIHQRSERASQPFLAVNCSALAEGVLESELFGHVKGAFTGAVSQRDGLFAAAGAGTVFLDEIGEVSPAIQVKLLRVLQERMVRPVGATQEQPVEARVLAATNKRLETEVRSGKFREDLLYRLNVITIDVPPLRERAEDIPGLAQHFLAQCADQLGRPGLRLDPETLALLQRYHFPGNVRQLQNIIERAATLSVSDHLEPSSLPNSLRGEPDPIDGSVSLNSGFSLERFLDDAERRYLKQALVQAVGVKTRAAELLGLSFRSFRYRLAKHGLGDANDS